MFEINVCEVCDNDFLESVLNLGEIPLNECLLPIGSSEVCKKYPIEILFCNKCFTAHQRFQVPKNELFEPTYKYRARMTNSVLIGMSNVVDSCEDHFGNLTEKLVLDIGCNDGSLLNFFREKGCRTVGVDPTDAADDSKHPTIKAYFDETAVNTILREYGKPDLITFTNVFAHIENLPELLVNLKKLVDEKTNIVIENHYLGAILETGQFDTFYHEHPRTYSKKSFEFIAATMGMKLLDVEFVSRYGGNIRAFIGNSDNLVNKTVNEDFFIDEFRKLSFHIMEWKKITRKRILEYVEQNGKIKAKAFPGRAAILINILGLNENHISAVYEITGSIKTGYYIPGTKIPILSEIELYQGDLTQPILNLAWHLPKEVRKNLKSHGYIGEVIDIKNADIKE